MGNGLTCCGYKIFLRETNRDSQVGERTRLGYVKVYCVSGRGLGPMVGAAGGGEVVD